MESKKKLGRGISEVSKYFLTDYQNPSNKFSLDKRNSVNIGLLSLNLSFSQVENLGRQLLSFNKNSGFIIPDQFYADVLEKNIPENWNNDKIFNQNICLEKNNSRMILFVKNLLDNSSYDDIHALNGLSEPQMTTSQQMHDLCLDYLFYLLFDRDDKIIDITRLHINGIVLLLDPDSPAQFVFCYIWTKTLLYGLLKQKTPHLPWFGVSLTKKLTNVDYSLFLNKLHVLINDRENQEFYFLGYLLEPEFEKSIINLENETRSAPQTIDKSCVEIEHRSLAACLESLTVPSRMKYYGSNRNKTKSII